ncbi:MAG: SIS domain-containing protein [Dehalococcoidia bacterium]|nr:MAG: SIS domain-containing protein [Dehalococcoidia bacterium]
MTEHEASDGRSGVARRVARNGNGKAPQLGGNGHRPVTRAMILAAGEGTRMRPLTDRMPKPMVPIAGRPLLEHTIENLAEAGVREIAINLHAHAGVIADHLGDGSRFGVKITYSFEPRLLGTAGAVKALEHFFAGGPFFVVYGDVFARLDLGQLVQHHRDRHALATIALRRPDDVTQCGIVEQDDDGWITGFTEKPASVEDETDTWANGGVYVLEPGILRHIPDGIEQDFGRDVFPALVRTGRAIAGFRADGGCWDIGSMGRLRQVDLLFRSSGLASPRRQSIGRAVGEYLTKVAGAVDSLDRGCIVRAAELLLDARARGRRIYIIGNGGSASTASHMAADLSRAALETDGLPLNCRCLSDSMAIVSAWGNDVGFDSVFERQLTQLVEPGDVLVAISASGNSPNILAAVELARTHGAYVLGFSGFGGGLLAKMADVAIVVASSEYGPVEDLHLLLNHLLAAVMRRLDRRQVEEREEIEDDEPAFAAAAAGL